MRNLFEIFLGCSCMSYNFFQISCMSVSLLVGLLPYWKWTNIRISPVLNEISFWFFGDIPGCWYTCYKWFWISCMSVSLFVCLLHYQIRQRDISSSRLDIFLIFWRHSSDVGSLLPNNLELSLLVGLLSHYNKAIEGISPFLYEIYFWNFV